MRRVSMKELEERCQEINKILGKPLEYRNEETCRSNVGYHYVYGSQSGYRVHIIINEHGGVTAKFISDTKAILLGKLNAYLDGLREGMCLHKS
jgi:hypothetical protein